MLADLKLSRKYDGLIYLAESARNVPKLDSHHHVELELNLVVRGWITYVVGERCFTFPARTLLWLFPEQEHQMVARSADAQFYVAVFKPGLIVRSCRTPAYASLKRGNYQTGAVLNTHLSPDAFDLIRKTMDSLMPGSLDSDLLNREAGYGWLSNFSYQHGDPDGLNAGLRHLLLLCWRSQRTGKVRGDAKALHRAVRRALQLLSDGGSEMNLGRLARACGTSEAYLSRTFRKQIGVPLSRYRNSLRLSRFWEEYREPEEKTMAEAVYAAGFGSYAQFYKVFTQAYGEGPRACLTSASHPER
jgi:methylphosphotriester-DNA--protein-cysteine methyltransferase